MATTQRGLPPHMLPFRDPEVYFHVPAHAAGSPPSTIPPSVSSGRLASGVGGTNTPLSSRYPLAAGVDEQAAHAITSAIAKEGDAQRGFAARSEGDRGLRAAASQTPSS